MVGKWFAFTCPVLLSIHCCRPPAVSSSRGGGVKHELTGETVGDPVHMEITEGTGRIVWIDMLTTGAMYAALVRMHSKECVVLLEVIMHR